MLNNPETSPPDILVAGLPGPLLWWARELVVAAATTCSAVVQPPVDGDGGWAPRGEDDATAARLFFTDYVGETWANLIRDGRLRAIFVIVDPAVAVSALLAVGQGIAATMRHLSALATVLGELINEPSVLTVSDCEHDDADHLMQAILTHLGLTPEAADIAGLYERFGILPSYPVTESQGWTSETPALIEAALAPACHYARTGERTPVTWLRACLLWGDRPGESLPRILDLTGPARVVVYGPYFRLPQGRWLMRATIACSPSSAGAPLALELHGRAELGRCKFRVPHAGLFTASLPVTVPSSWDTLEMRLVIERGAIEGAVGIDEIELIPQAD